MNFVLGFAKFTVPDLLLTLFHNRAGLVEDTFARITEFRVAGCQLASTLKAIKGDLEYICVKLDFNFFSLSLGSCVSAPAEVNAD